MGILFLNARAMGSLLGWCHTGLVLPPLHPSVLLVMHGGAVGFASPLPERRLAVLQQSPAALEALPTNVICLGPGSPG